MNPRSFGIFNSPYGQPRSYDRQIPFPDFPSIDSLQRNRSQRCCDVQFVPIFAGSPACSKRCSTVLDHPAVAKTDLSDNSNQSFAPGTDRRRTSRPLRFGTVTHLEGTAGLFTVSMSLTTDARLRRLPQARAKGQIPGRHDDLHLDSDAFC